MHGSVLPMHKLLILAIHVLVTCANLLRPGGVRAVAAESLLLKHQLVISNRSRQRAPNLTSGICCRNGRRGTGRGVEIGEAGLGAKQRKIPGCGWRIRSMTESACSVQSCTGWHAW